MPTYLSAAASDTLRDFAVALGSAARLFTAAQVARHPVAQDRSNPLRAVREVLNRHPDVFERLPGKRNQPYLWRLTKTARNRYGVREKAVPGNSQRSEHWLGLGDIFCALAFAGGRPKEWRTEWEKQFDVYCKWADIPLLIEYQRTPITSKQWAAKWSHRAEWYSAQEWIIRPRVVLVDLTGQRDDTINPPRGTIHVRSAEEMPRALMRAKQKSP